MDIFRLHTKITESPMYMKTATVMNGKESSSFRASIHNPWAYFLEWNAFSIARSRLPPETTQKSWATAASHNGKVQTNRNPSAGCPGTQPCRACCHLADPGPRGCRRQSSRLWQESEGSPKPFGPSPSLYTALWQSSRRRLLVGLRGAMGCPRQSWHTERITEVTYKKISLITQLQMLESNQDRGQIMHKS